MNINFKSVNSLFDIYNIYKKRKKSSVFLLALPQ